MKIRRASRRVFSVLGILILSLGLADIIMGGTTGKIVGVVRDAKTGEGLPGANVVLVGTGLGAVSDIDGSYVIINVPVGTYSVRVSYIGYREAIASNVKSIQDLTTTQNFNLEPTVIVVGEKPIVVEAIRPLVEPSATGTTRLTSSKEIDAMVVYRPQDVVAITAGAVGSGNSIYIRGGRRDEVSYFVDGLSINDPVVGGAGLNVNKLAIQEVMVQTGGFSAEYGEAMSGIVNVVTKEGGDKFSGLVRYSTDQILGNLAHNYNLWETSIGGSLPGLKKMKFYFSGELNLTDDHRPLFIDKIDGQIWERVPIPRLKKADGTDSIIDINALYSQYGPFSFDKSKPWIWADTIAPKDTINWTKADWDSFNSGAWGRVVERRINEAGFDGWRLVKKKFFPFDEEQTYRIQGKLTYEFTKTIKLSLGALRSRDQFGSVDEVSATGWNAWKYHLHDGFYAGLRKGAQYNATWRHQIGKRIFYILSLNRFETSYKVAPRHPGREAIRAGKWWKDFEFYSDKDEDNDNIFDEYNGRAGNQFTQDNPYGVRGFFYGGNGLSRLWSWRYDAYNGVKADFTTQLGRVGKLHEVKTGVEGKIFKIDRKYNSLPWDANAFRDYYSGRKPMQASFYVTDKMEFEGLIVNAGVRFDYLNANAYKLVSPFIATRNSSDSVKAKPKYKFSPRIGISHPISEQTVLRFNYGHFFQTPQLQYLFESVASNISYPTWIARGNQILGDPDLAAQQTINYEAGFAHQFREDVAGDVSLYYKDIYGYTGTKDSFDITTGNSVALYQNFDYGNVRGMELALQKRPGAGIFSGRVSYSLSYAKGSASDPREGYISRYYGYPIEKVDHPLDFDQRHTFSSDFNFAFGEKFGPKVGGNKVLSNINLNFLTTMGSGLPYSPLDLKGQRVGSPNSARMPWTMKTDMRITKDLKLFGLGTVLACEVVNLFNRKNVLSVYATTGSPDFDGEVIDPASFTTRIPAYFYGSGDTLGGGVHPQPNPSYNKLRDIDQKPEYDKYGRLNYYLEPWEQYQTYMAAKNDYMKNPARFGTPRQVRLQIGIRW